MKITNSELAASSAVRLTKAQSDLCFVAFALNECLVETDARAAKYLRAVHRTALEIAVPNYFGVSVGGFWLTSEQITKLRALPDHYTRIEAPCVARAVSAYLRAQLRELYDVLYSLPAV
jgi:hypothetical protein